MNFSMNSISNISHIPWHTQYFALARPTSNERPSLARWGAHDDDMRVCLYRYLAHNSDFAVDRVELRQVLRLPFLAGPHLGLRCEGCEGGCEGLGCQDRRA